MASSVGENVLEFSETNNILLMTLMEEITENEEAHVLHDHDECYGEDDDRLVSMIQSLEAVITSQHDGVGHVEGQDCSTSSVNNGDDDHLHGYYDWTVDMEETACMNYLSSSAPLDEFMMMEDALSPGATGGDDSNYYSELYYGVLMEQEISETNYNYYLPQQQHIIY